MTAYAVGLDGALGDTRALWLDWVASSSDVLGVDPAAVPEDRAEAAALLDASDAGNWRALLARFAEDHAAVYLRPNAEVSAALRRLSASGARIGVFSDAPAELAQVALAQLGASRRVDALEAGENALPRLLERLGAGTVVVTTRAALVAAAAAAS